MKSKTFFYSIAVIAVASALTFSGCKKKQAFNNEDGQSSTDNRDVAGENDAATNDVNRGHMLLRTYIAANK